MKTYLHKTIKILQFISRGKIKKCLTCFRNILAFSISYNLGQEILGKSNFLGQILQIFFVQDCAAS